MNYSIGELQSFVKDILVTFKTKEAKAELFAKILVESDMWGIPSHGIKKVIQYVWMIENNHIKLDSEPEQLSEFSFFKSFDAKQGLGHVNAYQITLESMVLARKNGMGMATAKNLTHTGMLGYYSFCAAKEGLICLIMSSGPTKVLPALNGATPLFGTSPFSYAIPMENKAPIILDISLAAMPLNRLRMHAENNIEIPIHIGVDKNGKPTSNAKKVLNGGHINWTGDHKGYGLGILFEIMSGGLSGGTIGDSKPASDPNSQNPSDSCINVICIDPKKIMNLDFFNQKIDELYQDIKSSKPSSPDHEVLLPGQSEMRKREESFTNGVEVDSKTVAKLNKLAKKLRSTKLRHIEGEWQATS